METINVCFPFSFSMDVGPADANEHDGYTLNQQRFRLPC